MEMRIRRDATKDGFIVVVEGSPIEYRTDVRGICEAVQHLFIGHPWDQAAHDACPLCCPAESARR